MERGKIMGLTRVAGILAMAMILLAALGACGPRGQQTPVPGATSVPTPTATPTLVPVFPALTPTGTVPSFFPTATADPFAQTPTLSPPFTPTPAPTATPTPVVAIPTPTLVPTPMPTPIPTTALAPTATPIPIPTPTPGLGMSARITSYTPQMVTEVIVGQPITLSMTFVNTGTATARFIGGVSVWDASNRLAGNEDSPELVLGAGETRTIQWSFVPVSVGSHRVQFGVWRGMPFTAPNLLHKWPDPSQMLINARAQAQGGGQ